MRLITSEHKMCSASAQSCMGQTTPLAVTTPAFNGSPLCTTMGGAYATNSSLRFYAQVFPESGRSDTAILDICSSWVSHYPKDYKASRVAGLGMSGWTVVCVCVCVMGNAIAFDKICCGICSNMCGNIFCPYYGSILNCVAQHAISF